MLTMFIHVILVILKYANASKERKWISTCVLLISDHKKFGKSAGQVCLASLFL
jgi:hypothetical protein